LRPFQTHENTPHMVSFTRLSSTDNAMSGSQDQQPSAESSTSTRKQPTLALPSITEAEATRIDVSSGSGTARLDALGPMVVNVDGTLSRITNRDNMTEMEQNNTLRILTKRNKERLETLKIEQGEGKQS
jgi:hypothetical protein